MSPLTLCIIASATFAYIIWTYQILKSKPGSDDETPTFSSMFLWSIIDGIMWWSTRRAGNDQTLIATYTVLTITLMFIIFAKKGFEWKKTDNIVAGIAAACLGISYLSSPIVAVTTGALSISAAGIPNIIKLTKLKVSPSKLLYLTIFFFTAGPLLTLTDLGMYSNLKEYIYPSIAIVYWSVNLCIVMYKSFMLRTPITVS